MRQWWDEIIPEQNKFLLNKDVASLVQRALHSYEGQLSHAGALVISTGRFTGRAAEDKYVVREAYSEERMNWSQVRSLTPILFDNIKDEFVRHFKSQLKSIYLMERSVGADPDYSLGIRLATTQASHALFARNMFREAVSAPKLGFFTIYHCPELEIDPSGYGLRSSTVIALNFETKEILIGGTAYAGEVKKAVFSVMNTLLPDHQVLPMHSGANTDAQGRVSVFFGLSGTGKTTLSTDEGKKLIGDDEHGLSQDRTFNFEGGCYAKTYKLSKESEPQIYKAVNRFGALLENVTLDEEHRPLFDDKSHTENGRASYPLEFIDDYLPEGVAAVPENLFFLSADAMGVLPAVSKLDLEQSLYYFLSGYTAKLAGTELGSTTVKATFSHCFGAPFMMRHPRDYADLLGQFLKRNKTQVWLINTGWYGGPYGSGERYSIKFTRSIVRAIQQGLTKETTFNREKNFGLSLPAQIPGVEKEYLDPRGLWRDKEAYDSAARELRELFENNYKNKIELKQH